MRYLLDTNICLFIHRQRPPAVLDRFSKLRAGHAAISVITCGELLYGAERSQQKAKALRALDEFSGLVPVLPMPDAAG